MSRKPVRPISSAIPNNLQTLSSSQIVKRVDDYYGPPPKKNRIYPKLPINHVDLLYYSFFLFYLFTCQPPGDPISCNSEVHYYHQDGDQEEVEGEKGGSIVSSAPPWFFIFFCYGLYVYDMIKPRLITKLPVD